MGDSDGIIACETTTRGEVLLTNLRSKWAKTVNPRLVLLISCSTATSTATCTFGAYELLIVRTAVCQKAPLGPKQHRTMKKPSP